MRSVLVHGYETMVMVGLHFTISKTCHPVASAPFSAHIWQCAKRSVPLQARMLLEDPSSEEHILGDWRSLLPQVLQEWGINREEIAAFSDGYRNASLIKDRVSFPP